MSPFKYPIIAGIATLLMLFCDSGLAKAGAYDGTKPIGCEIISLVLDADPMSDRSLTSTGAPVAAPDCEKIIREFIDDEGHPRFVDSGAEDDISIGNNAREKVDKLCMALIARYNIGASKPATACRLRFPSGSTVFEGLLALVRSKQLMISHIDPSRNPGYDSVGPGACVDLPLPPAGDAKNALAQYLVKEFGAGADWAGIAEHLRRIGFADAHRSFLFVSSFATTTGRELPSRSSEYHSEKKGLTIWLGVADHLPRANFDIGYRFQENLKPKFVCGIVSVTP